MAKTFTSVTPATREWIARQPMFFVATAPLSAEGHVNCSPKGMDSFRVIDEHTVGYLDLTGSGIETTAHLQENGRIVIMFCAFEGAPRIVRLHGRGEVVYPESPDHAILALLFPALAGARSIIRVRVTRVSDSCGYGVPLMTYVEDRRTLLNWAEKKSPDEIDAFRRKHNVASIDGGPGYLPVASPGAKDAGSASTPV